LKAWIFLNLEPGREFWIGGVGGNSFLLITLSVCLYKIISRLYLDENRIYSGLIYRTTMEEILFNLPELNGKPDLKGRGAD
jgi:hypothetical protein